MGDNNNENNEIQPPVPVPVAPPAEFNLRTISCPEDALRALNALEAYIADDLPALEDFARLNGPMYAEIRRLKVLLECLSRLSPAVYYRLDLDVHGRIDRAAMRLNKSLVLESPEQAEAKKEARRPPRPGPSKRGRNK